MKSKHDGLDPKTETSKLCFTIFAQRSEVSLHGTPSESPKVMELVGIHDPAALHYFGSITYPLGSERRVKMKGPWSITYELCTTG